LVLRFLAEDVGRELDLVLDSIHRALNHRGSPPSANITASPAMLRMAGVPADERRPDMGRQIFLPEIRQRLVDVHGRRLHGIVLYGSEARGASSLTATSMS
jgi:hypothetical protein